jgi:hypothetical protein
VIVCVETLYNVKIPQHDSFYESTSHTLRTGDDFSLVFMVLDNISQLSILN